MENQDARPTRIEAHLRLLRLADALGPYYGTEDLAVLLYSIIRMQKPETVVELGTGLGVSALWMAHAAECNGLGEVYTVDDLDLWRGDDRMLSTVLSVVARAGVGNLQASSPDEYFSAMARMIGVEQRLIVVERRMRLDEPGHFDGYPFAKRPIGLLFSDFLHGPDHLQWLLTHFLPRMAPSSSILIDSVGSEVGSFLAIEQLVHWLNRGRIPEAMRRLWSADAVELVRGRRLRLLHLPETKDRPQNTTSWIQVEPADPWPAGARP